MNAAVPTRRLTDRQIKIAEYIARKYAKYGTWRFSELVSECQYYLTISIPLFDPSKHPKGEAGLDAYLMESTHRRLLSFLSRPGKKQKRLVPFTDIDPYQIDKKLSVDMRKKSNPVHFEFKADAERLILYMAKRCVRFGVNKKGVTKQKEGQPIRFYKDVTKALRMLTSGSTIQEIDDECGYGTSRFLICLGKKYRLLRGL